jgi:hypothetical protein
MISEFTNIKERENLRVKTVSNSTEKNGNAQWWFDYGKLNNEKFFFNFSALMPIGNKKATVLDHSYEFVTNNPGLVNSDSKELAELFATLVIRTIDKYNQQSHSDKLTHVGLEKLKNSWSSMLIEHKLNPPKENWLLKQGKDERRYIAYALSAFSIIFGVIFHIYFFILIFLQLLDFQKDRLGILNYGFAIMIGLSAVCFSWARNLLTENKNRAERISDTGSEALFGALAFLIGITFQHVAVTRDIPYLSDLLSYTWLVSTIKILAVICFLVATFTATRVIKELLLITMINRLESYEKRKDWIEYE